MSTIAVSGANGFIGSELVRSLLDAGNQVVAIDREGCTWNLPLAATGLRFVPASDIEECSLSVDVFCHLAWVGKAGPARADWSVQLDNVRMALRYYGHARRFGCSRFVCAGTIGEMLLEKDGGRQLKSQNAIYVNSKRYLHNLLNIIQDASCPVIWMMLGNMYGCGESGGSIIDYALKSILKGEEALFGPAEQPYDFINVKDAIRGLALILQKPVVKGREFYLGNGMPRALKEWLIEVGEVAGRPELIKIGARPDDGTRFENEWFSTSLMREETGFAPTIKFKDGIRDNIEYLARSK